MGHPFERLPYNPKELERELKPFYISATDEEIDQMLENIGASSLEDLFNHINKDVLFKETPDFGPHLSYEDLIVHVEEVAAKNKITPHFLGAGLETYKVPDLVGYVSNIRGLTTAYTPYQPERSQGTLQTLWLYASALSKLTGFEAINASFYERSTCLYEAANTALRIKKNKKTVLVTKGLYEGDQEVLETLAKETALNFIEIPLDESTGLLDQSALKKITESNDDIAALIFMQKNNNGTLEEVHELTRFCVENNLLSIGVIDPMLLSTGGLVPPSEWGDSGCTMIVGEGQGMAIGPNYGGPGLGIFGIRYNENDKLSIRQTAGRYVGKAKDSEGKEALAMVLSTREQHIRREKATSNICSNQSFLATLAGAAILARGEGGMKEAVLKGHNSAYELASTLLGFEGVELAYCSAFFNSFCLKITKASDLKKEALSSGIIPGAFTREDHLLITLTDLQTESDLKDLISVFEKTYGALGNKKEIPTIKKDLLRSGAVGLPNFNYQELTHFYDELGKQNVSPDDNIYPLGSCTMKYNPYINDYAAGLPGITDLHPECPDEFAQGSLEILYETQEIFKTITGLPGLTTEPVAGAQGELVGLKLFQAYHRDKGNGETKNIILIPKSAHGTNPATATMAGFESKKIDGVQVGIVTIGADDRGQINFPELEKLVKEYNTRIAGIMVTNPNTSGIFEERFKDMADLIHSVDGLVYMDGANMNAIASWVDLGALGVDAVHNNLHKTWTIPHGGGGPGDAIVAVSEKLIPYLPGIQVIKEDGIFKTKRMEKSIGSFHRHYGNFAHKVRCYTYLKALGSEGTRKMSAVAVLAAKYLYENIKDIYPTLPAGTESVPRMHEFILTIKPETFSKIEASGTPKAQSIAKIGKLFLDFGLHAPTVAFPEILGMMVEPTESFDKKELDSFLDVLKAIHLLVNENPEVLLSTPHFTPIKKVDEVSANKNLRLSEDVQSLPEVLKNIVDPGVLTNMSTGDVIERILKAHKENTL
ncbi:MAG: glycine dehydrogenase [Bacteriovoracaceae bacterium]|jgi:glycine dehydrogenase